jgi:polyferredoxin
LTVVFGRFFCGFVCPFGALHQFVGYLAHRKRKAAAKIKLNEYRKAQSIKYYILIMLLMSAVVPTVQSLQIGLLDPIPLFTRSVNTVLLPLVDNNFNAIFTIDRATVVSFIILAIFLAAVLMNFVVPRFFCRFVCPLGALFGVFGRFALLRIGKNSDDTINCRLCEKNCEGGCEPAGQIRISECVLCFNCRNECQHDLISYQTPLSAAGEMTSPDIGRRGVTASLLTGVLAIPAIRLSAQLGQNWNNKIIRPPGSLPEEQFLERCLKCGQCMRVCPTNVLQPAGLDKGVEALWTPVLNNRIGSSGCQLNCTACGHICPTAAIRPISLEEKFGKGEYASKGPIKLGTAFFDRNRCLPWAMNKPCLVCQENCPVSPKAIWTKTVYETIRDGQCVVQQASSDSMFVDKSFANNALSSGDYYVVKEGDLNDQNKLKIVSNAENGIFFEQKKGVSIRDKDAIMIQVRLQRPYVDIEKCIGCGICEHECPVSGKRAIRVSAEGQSREYNTRMLLKSI